MRVGFIGLGTMGASMALNVQTAEHEVAVNDLRRDAATPHLKAGATWADGPREIAMHSEVILTSLPGPREVEAVADILIEHMKPGTAWFDLSTNSPTVVRKLHARFAAKGLAMLDAPVSGGPAGAKSGKLALLIGGDKAVFDKFKPVLDAVGDQVIYIGQSLHVGEIRRATTSARASLIVLRSKPSVARQIVDLGEEQILP